MQTFWEWENNLLDQEERYWEQKLRDLKAQIDQEIRDRLAQEEIGLDAARELEIRTDIANKHAKTKKLLIAGWEQAKHEGEKVFRQKDERKYQRLYIKYAYPLQKYQFTERELAQFQGDAAN